MSGPDCRLTPSQRLIALTLGFMLNRETRSWVVRASTIAERTGLSVATVKRGLSVLTDGPSPMFSRARTKRTDPEGRRLLGAYRYTLVENVERFTARRDRSREEKRGILAAVRGERGSVPTQELPAWAQELADQYDAEKRDIAQAWANRDLDDDAYRAELSRLDAAYQVKVQRRPRAQIRAIQKRTQVSQ